jgi:hypothetical protein
MWNGKFNKKFVVFAVVLAMVVGVCAFDHGGPVNGAVKHSHTASSDCSSNSCLALISQDGTSSVKTAGSFLLLSVLLIFGLGSPSLVLDARNRLLFFRSNLLPRASTRLYQLHAVYRL